MIEMDINVLMYQFGIIVGLFLISYIPYLVKKKEDDSVTWNHYYTVNALYSYILSIVGSFVLLKINPLDPSVVNAFGEGLILGLASTPTLKYLRDLFGLNDGKETP